MTGIGNGNRPLDRADFGRGSADANLSNSPGANELQIRVRRLSLREQIERNHFLLKRLNAASARLIEALESGDVFEAIGEIIANVIGSEEVAIFHYFPLVRTLKLAWSSGVGDDILRAFASGAGLLGRAVHEQTSQFAERQSNSLLLPHEKNVTACIVLKSSHEVVGVIAIVGLLPQKSSLEWVDYELLKFLETYGAVAIQFQRLNGEPVAP